MERRVGRAYRRSEAWQTPIQAWAVLCLVAVCGAVACAQDTTPPVIDGGILCLNGGGEPCEVALEVAQDLSFWVMLIVEEETCLEDENALNVISDNPLAVFRETNRELATSSDPGQPAAALIVSGYLDVNMAEICAPETVTLTARAVDCAGNEAVTSYRVNFVDNTAPWAFSPSNGQPMAGLLPGRYPLDSSGGIREIPISFSMVDNYCLDCAGATVSMTLSTEGGISARKSITVEPVSGTLNELYVSGNIEYWGDAPGTVIMDVSGQDASGLTIDFQVQHTIYEEIPPTILVTSEPAVTFAQDACQGTVILTAEVSDNWAIDADSGQISVNVTAPAFATIGETIVETQTADDLVMVDATITLTDQESCPGTVDLVILAADNSGNQAAPVSRTVEVTDPWAPVIDFPALADVAIGATGEAVIPVAATVTDNCRVDPADVTVSVTPTNVTILSNDITVTQGASEDVVEVGGSITVHALSGCPATVVVEIDAADLCGSTSNEAQTVGILDHDVPVIDFEKPDDVIMDAACQATIPVLATIADNGCVAPGHVTVTVTPVNVAVTSNTITVTQGVSANEVLVGGSLTVEALTGCPAEVEITIEAMDCCGTAGIATSSHTVLVTDDQRPVIDVPKPSDATVNGSCQATIPISGTVTDNCCLVPSAVTVSVIPTNVLVLSNDITKTQGASAGVVDLDGSITVHQMTGCPAQIEIGMEAVDCCGANTAVPVVYVISVSDDEGPQISIDIAPVDGNDDVGVSCEEALTFEATVTDNCCIDAGNVLVTAELSAPNATLDYDPATDLVITQVDDRTVRIVGSAAVRCLTGCPARLAVTVDAADCCGNAKTAESSHLQGRVYDRFPPESVADDVEVSMNLPYDIDVLANDGDNCMSLAPESPCSCCGSLWIHNVVALPVHGTVTILDDAASCGSASVIRYQPDEGFLGSDGFTYRAVDACGNLGPVTSVSIDVQHPSERLTLVVRGPGDVTVEYGAVHGLPVAYLNTDPEDGGIFTRWEGEHAAEVREGRDGGWVLALDGRKEVEAVFTIDPWEREAREIPAGSGGWRTASIPGLLTSDGGLCTGVPGCGLGFADGEAGHDLGQGFWLWLEEGVSLAIETACPKTYARVYLVEGWNLIGSPFDRSVPFSGIQIFAQHRAFTAEEAVAEGILGVYAFSFADGDYLAYHLPDCCLQPWTGYYVWASELCELKISQPEAVLGDPAAIDLDELLDAGVTMPPSPPVEP